MDHSIIILTNVSKLINSKYEPYCRTGCKVGTLFLQILNDKIGITKKAGITAESNPIYEERLFKCNKIIDLFKSMFKSKRLNFLCKRQKNLETYQIAQALYTDLEFFLKPYI